MKIYRQHKCPRTHRTIRTFLNCAIPNNVWITGTGNIAVIAWCKIPSITLWHDETQAHRAKDMIDQTGCGGRCNRRHDIVKVNPS